MAVSAKWLSNFNNKYLNNNAQIAALAYCDAYTFTTTKNVHEIMTCQSLVFKKQRKKGFQSLTLDFNKFRNKIRCFGIYKVKIARRSERQLV